MLPRDTISFPCPMQTLAQVDNRAVDSYRCLLVSPSSLAINLKVPTFTESSTTAAEARLSSATRLQTPTARFLFLAEAQYRLHAGLVPVAVKDSSTTVERASLDNHDVARHVSPANSNGLQTCCASVDVLVMNTSRGLSCVRAMVQALLRKLRRQHEVSSLNLSEVCVEVTSPTLNI
jgi:hypothetical protein